MPKGARLACRWTSKIKASTLGNCSLFSIVGRFLPIKVSTSPLRFSCQHLWWIKNKSAHRKVVEVVSVPAPKNSRTLITSCSSVKTYYRYETPKTFTYKKKTFYVEKECILVGFFLIKQSKYFLISLWI